MIKNDSFLWVEKYRPRTIDDCILPDSQKKYFNAFVKKGEIQNMLLVGSAGTGKTTVARALCEQLETDYLLINGSVDNGIDTLRNQITNFSSSISLSGKVKVIIIDEADGLNPKSIQPGLRNFIEEFANNVRFIFTANYRSKIIPALQSRCAVIEFKLNKEDRTLIGKQFFKRVREILIQENVGHDPEIVGKVVKSYFPDFRRTLNELQRFSQNNQLQENVLSSLTEESLLKLINHLKAKEWQSMREWVVENSFDDVSVLLKRLYDALSKKTKMLPQLVMIICDYSYKSAFVIDQEILLTACLTEIMTQIEIDSNGTF